MQKIKLIIAREYFTRVSKKSFWLLSLLGPVLMAALMIVPMYLAQMKDETVLIKVVDETSIFANTLTDNNKIKFDYSLEDITVAKSNLYQQPYTAILYLPRTVLNLPEGIMLYYKKEPGMFTQTYLEKEISKQLQKRLLEANSVDKRVLDKLNDRVKIQLIDIDEEGKEREGNAEIKTILGYVAAFMIYMFVFLYASQVMRGVIEEKSNRIIEVIISSVKPFELMMGKIIGVALVGLTQFMLWVVLTFTLTTVVGAFIGQNKYDSATIKSALNSSQELSAKQRVTMENFATISDSITDIDFPVIVVCFIIFFLGGYLIYSALFAAMGAAVDSEADTQQFMLPLSSPLILGIIMLQHVLMNPDSTLSFWFSMFPLTSPIVMMARIPFGVPYWQIGLSIGLLILGFIGTVWLAGRIYRVGIMMYGKKATYKEIMKWITYKS
ncbi:MAG: ABC transporter permease [Bacteroidia bacterium]|nr:ABC transporter permease [Bacteroidia bacterium]